MSTTTDTTTTETVDTETALDRAQAEVRRVAALLRTHTDPDIVAGVPADVELDEYTALIYTKDGRRLRKSDNTDHVAAWYLFTHGPYSGPGAVARTLALPSDRRQAVVAWAAIARYVHGRAQDIARHDLIV